MKKRIVLCADDYGQAPSISEGILDLLAKKRLSAVSCMVNLPNWPDVAVPLVAYLSQASIGLHLNLTEGVPVSNAIGQSFHPLPTLMRKSIFGQLDPVALEAEICAQIDRFTEALGTPAFIDGHQHVHQFPQIRDVFLKIYQSRFQTKMPYVRQVCQPMRVGDGADALKKGVLRLLGAAKFKGQLTQLGIPHNATFSGMYNFNKSSNYPQKLNQFLAEISDKGIIMCHPGLRVPGSKDPIADARFDEYTYLSSDRFLSDCEAHGVVLSKDALV